MMHCSYTVYCDVRGDDCMEHGSTAVGHRDREEARIEAKRAAFARRRVNGKMIDVCSRCLEGMGNGRAKAKR